MNYLYATLHTLGAQLRDRTERLRTEETERGASTIEIVFWAVALLALAGVVYAAIQAYITNKIQGIH